MGTWRSHVRAQLLQRDHLQRDQFSGLFHAHSRLLDKCELWEKVWEETQKLSGEGQSLGVPFYLYLSLRESEQARDKLKHTVADLKATMYLKDAELQYCHSQVSRYRREAVLHAHSSAVLRDELSECQFAMEQQESDLAALRSELKAVAQELNKVQCEKEQLQERWLQEKMEEAERMNQTNEAEERWQRLTNQLTKRLRKRDPAQFGEKNRVPECPRDVNN